MVSRVESDWSYPVDDASIPPMRLIAYGGHGICMGFWGVTDGESGHMAIIEKGEVRISKYIQGAGEEALKILRNGDYFGEMALIDGFPRSATAIANTDVTALVIDKAALDGALAGNRELESKLLKVFCKTLSERLRDTNDKISAFLAMTFGFGGPI